MKILPAITTIYDWRSRLEELKPLNLKEIALFLTCVNPKEREEIYTFLKSTKVEQIPFVHLRGDVSLKEINYLIKNYNTKTFNLHTKKEFPYPPDFQQYKNMTYIENTFNPLDEEEVGEFAGICLDFAHLENSRVFKPALYKHNVEVIDKFTCGCNHISPAKDFSLFEVDESDESPNWSAHILDDFSQLDYLKNYPKKYFAEVAALEMENSLKEQLSAKDYIMNMLGD